MRARPRTAVPDSRGGDRQSSRKGRPRLRRLPLPRLTETQRQWAALPLDLVHDPDASTETVTDALGKAGLLGLLSATSVGGMGLGLAEAAQVVERGGDRFRTDLAADERR